MASPQIIQALKASGKSMAGIGGVALAYGAVTDYKGRQEKGSSGLVAGIGTVVGNILPNLLISGPRGAVYNALIYGLPMIPAVAGAVAATSQSREQYIRRSAQPFTHYGYAPTMGAIQSMQRCAEQTSNMRGLSQTHAGLASQALRR